MVLAKQIPNLTSGRLLARSTVWNLLGQILPMVVGLFAVPPLIRGLGVERFSLLSLAWVLIGYFSLFDLGLGRATTKLIADKLAANEPSAVPALAWTSLALMFALGLFGGLCVLAVGPPLVHNLLKIPPALQPEALWSIFVLAAAVPVVTITSGLRGILEAQQQFRILNVIRIPMGIYSFAGPLLALPFSRTVTAAVGVLVAGRLIGGAVHVIACFRAMPELRKTFRLQRSLIFPLLSFGSWMTVSAVLSPLMVYLDRFLIGAFLSLSAVAYYATPFDFITRIWIVPGAVSGVLFPALAISLSQDQDRAGLLLARGTKYIFLAVFPVVLAIVIFAPDILRFWLGPVFAQSSATVTRLLSAGVLVNCLAHMAFTLIQSAGRPDVTAKLHLLELPLYVAMLLMLLKAKGIEGAALAFLLRLAGDAAVSFFLAHRLVLHQSRFLLKLAGATVAALAILYFASLPTTGLGKLAACLGWLLALALVGRYWALAAEERSFLLGGWRTAAKLDRVQRS